MGKVPAYSFSLAVRVGGKVYGVGLFCLGAQLLYKLRLAFNILILRGEVMLHIHAQLAFGQVYYVPHAGHYLVVLAQSLGNGFNLMRRLHYQKLHYRLSSGAKEPAKAKRRRFAHLG